MRERLRQLGEALVALLVGFGGLALVMLAAPVTAAVGGAWGLALGILLIILGLILVQFIQ